MLNGEQIGFETLGLHSRLSELRSKAPKPQAMHTLQQLDAASIRYQCAQNCRRTVDKRIYSQHAMAGKRELKPHFRA